MQIDDLTLHWLAGLLEGEGSFTRGVPSRPHQPVLSLHMADEEIVAKVAGIFGVKYRSIKAPNERWSDTYAIRIVASKAVNVMESIKPLMGLRRQQQIEKAFETFEDKFFRALTAEQLEELRIRALNGESPFHLAKEYGISKTLAYYIKDGYNYTYSRGYSSVVERLPSKQDVEDSNSSARLIYKTVINELLEIPVNELYWLAGILEAEGSFLAPPPSSPNTPRISIAMTDEDVVARVAQLFGRSYYSWKPKNENHKTNYIVHLKGYRAVDLMRELHPLMGTRRQSQIDRATADFVFNPKTMGRTTGKPKLDADKVRQIKRRLARGDSHGVIADSYGVSRSTISSIGRGETWTDVTLDE